MQSGPSHVSALPKPARASLIGALSIALIGTSLTGGLQAAIVSVLRFGRHELVGLSPDFAWMGVLAYLPFFLLLGAILWLAGHVARPLGTLQAHAVLAALFGLLSLGLFAPRIAPWALLLVALGVSWRVAPAFAAVVERRPARALMAGAASLVLVFAAGWALRFVANRERQGAVPSPIAGVSADAPNVLVIILDTVRALSLSLYGHSRVTTPVLDSLGREGVVFEHAYSSAPWTLPSHGSLFTGRDPRELSGDYKVALDDSFPVLANAFRTRGYRTGGMVANLLYTGWESGVAQEFETWKDHRRSLRQVLLTAMVLQTDLARAVVGALNGGSLRQALRSLVRFEWANSERFAHYDRKWAPTINREFLAWIDEAPTQPFFSFLNYYDAHSPYKPRAPYDTRYDSAGVHRAVDLYEGAIEMLDHDLGALFSGLRERGLLDKTIVIVTSDHGEHFGERGLWEHGNGVFTHVTRVPLLVRYPPLVPGNTRVSTPVGISDVPATTLKLVGIEDRRFPGFSLDTLWRDASAKRTSPVLLEHVPGRLSRNESRRFIRGLVADSLHYIRFASGREHLFHLTRDPWQTQDLIGDPRFGATLEALRTEIDRRSPARR
jgi:arylsulfatase A-like enzyme